MPAVVAAGPPLDPEIAAHVQQLAQVALTAAARVSRVQSGDRNSKMPQDADSLEHALLPLVQGSDAMSQRLRRALAAPSRGIRLLPIDYANQKSVIDQAAARQMLRPLRISAESAQRLQSGNDWSATMAKIM